MEMEHREEHSKPNYVLVFVALAVLTIAEVLLSMVGEGGIVTVLLVLMSFAKIILVSMFYMHLRHDNKLYTYIFLIPIPFVLLIAAALLIAQLTPAP